MRDWSLLFRFDVDVRIHVVDHGLVIWLWPGYEGTPAIITVWTKTRIASLGQILGRGYRGRKINKVCSWESTGSWGLLTMTNWRRMRDLYDISFFKKLVRVKVATIHSVLIFNTWIRSSLRGTMRILSGEIEWRVPYFLNGCGCFR